MKRAAKFWLEPDVELFDAGSLSEKDIVRLQKVLLENRDAITTLIRNFALGVKVQPLSL